MLAESMIDILLNKIVLKVHDVTWIFNYRRKCEADGKEAKAELTQRNMFPSAQIKMR